MPVPVDDGGPVPATYGAHLTDYTWSVLTSFATVPGYGFNSFDLAFPSPLAANPLSVAFGSGCGLVSDVRIRALTHAESNTWETGARFGQIGAHFSSSSMRFVRVSFQETASATQCQIALYGAATPTPAAPPASPQGGLWYCQAAPFGNPQINYYYWYNQSVDFARYQVLSACTGAYGAVCSATCQAPAG